MSKKERKQSFMFKKLQAGEITQAEAARNLGISIRWVRKKYKRFIAKDDAGLVHGNRGKSSSRKWDPQHEEIALSLLKSDWHDFGPTFAAEQLAKQGIKVSPETLRKSMIKAGLWVGKQRRNKHRKWRERRACLGIMIQLDGSKHDWFEGRAPHCTLLVFIDDATSRILWIEFAESESLFGVMHATLNYMKRHGKPQSFYVDFGSVFSVNTNNPDREKITQFERAMAELGVTMIHAHSAQAKGRVERANKTLQDRLIKEMRLANISTMEAANEFAQTFYLSEHNRKFAVEAQESANLHESIDGYDTANIFCIKEERQIQNDYTVMYKKRIFQLSKEQKAAIRPKEYVTMHERFDGTVDIVIRNIALEFEKIGCRPIKIAAPPKHQTPSFPKPAKDHPWRRWVGPESQRFAGTVTMEKP